jgi:hypothetical protein
MNGFVDPQWRAWAADNLARGAAPEEVVAALVEAGVPAEHARACVASLAQQALARRAAALEQIVRLRAELRGAHRAIERTSLPDAEQFLSRFWAPGVPAIFTDLVTRWPAFGRWGPQDFVQRFGEVTIEACVSRDRSDDPDVRWAELTEEMTVAELVRRLQAAGNEAYVTTNNALLRRPEMAPLLHEIDLPAAISGSAMQPRLMGFWFGDAGTHTSFHHDHANAILCQVLGRKRVKLVPPESLTMLRHARGVYSEWNAEEHDPPPELVEVELAAGEALFLPLGWWHPRASPPAASGRRRADRWRPKPRSRARHCSLPPGAQPPA